MSQVMCSSIHGSFGANNNEELSGWLISEPLHDVEESKGVGTSSSSSSNGSSSSSSSGGSGGSGSGYEVFAMTNQVTSSSISYPVYWKVC